jgi:hypothetical protein
MGKGARELARVVSRLELCVDLLEQSSPFAGNAGMFEPLG